MSFFEAAWQSGDCLLDEALRQACPNGLVESVSGLIIFRRTNNVSVAVADGLVLYGHVVFQRSIYEGVHVDALCGVSMSLYDVKKVELFVGVNMLDDSLLCSKCCIQAEMMHWANS